MGKAKDGSDRGRPKMFTDPDILQDKINEYFEKECADEIMRTEEGNVLVDTKGRPVVKFHPPTISGLALYLGFVDRRSIYDYIEREDEFSHIIKRATTFIDNYAEQQLFVGNSTGAIFWLKNRGWIDRVEQQVDANVNATVGVTIVDDIK